MPFSKPGMLQYASTLIYKQTFTIQDFVKHMAEHCANMDVYNIIQRGATKAFGSLDASDVKAIIVHYEERGPEFVIVLTMALDITNASTGQTLGEIRTLLNSEGKVTTIISTTRFI